MAGPAQEIHSFGTRKIVHVDMDAFYASVEQRDDPRLRARPVAVAGSPEARGVVSAASYEARAYGVRSALPTAQALRLCPQLVVIAPNFQKYRAVSRQVFSIFREVTPLVEPLSLDEAYLDVTENAWGELLAAAVARGIKRRIFAETGLTASAGAAPNKFLAKIASAWKKPDGLTVVAPARAEAFLQKLPVDALWGVGPVTAARLRALGLHRLVDLRTADIQLLRRALGNSSERLRELAFGIDDRPVTPDRPWKSVSCEDTYALDLTGVDAIRAEAERLARRCASRLEALNLEARTVTLKVRYSNFETITRSQSGVPSRSPDEFARRAVGLLEKTQAGSRPVRLLGVAAHGLTLESTGAETDPLQLRLPV